MKSADRDNGVCRYCGRVLELKMILPYKSTKIYKQCDCNASQLAKKEAQEAAEKHEASVKQRKILHRAQELFKDAGLPLDAFRNRLSDLSIDMHNADAARKAELLCGGGLKFGQKWLWLQGQVGVGKTTIIRAIAREMAVRGRTIGYIHAAEIGRLFSARDYAVAGAFLKSNVYLLDDLGIEFPEDGSRRNQAVEMHLVTIFDTAYREKKFLVATSNFTPSEYCSKFSDMNAARIGRRIAEMSDIETLGGTMFTSAGVRI